MSKQLSARLATGAAVTVVAGLASAHTGHGHDGLSNFEGLWHALTELDHQVMLWLAVAFTTWAAPRVLRLVQRGLQALRSRLGAERPTTDVRQ